MSMFNNSSSALSHEFYMRQEINKYVLKLNFTLTFIQTFVSVIGLLGNILALIVINKKSLRNTSSAVFITYMAIFDSAVLLLHATMLARPRRNLFVHCSLTYLTDVFTFCANWVLVVITLERCVAVASPFLAKRFCSVTSARYYIFFLLTITITFFSLTFPIIHDIKGDLKRKKCVIRPQYVLFHRLFQPIVMIAIPDVLLLSNLFTVYTLIRRRIQHSSNNQSFDMRVSDVNSNRKQQQLTVMLVTVNLAFYLFTTPAMIIFIAEYSPPKHRDLYKLKRSFLFSQISVLLLQLNNATNFIFYCLSGQRFRQATMETFIDSSVGLKYFYHRYMLCNKQYSMPISYHLNKVKERTSAGTLRISYPSAQKQMKNRKFTL